MGEMEEFRAQLVGNIQNVQKMIAKAEQAQRVRSGSAQKRYCSDSASSMSRILKGENQKVQGGFKSENSNMSFKSIEQQPSVKKKGLPINQSIEGSKQLLHKTPDFRRYGAGSQAYNNYLESTNQKQQIVNSNEVIVYSD